MKKLVKLTALLGLLFSFNSCVLVNTTCEEVTLLNGVEYSVYTYAITEYGCLCDETTQVIGSDTFTTQCNQY